jgi:hypothetical protein
MQAYILLGALLGLPLLIGLIARVSTAHLFLALLSGELLQRYFGDDAVLAARTFVKDGAVQDYIGLAILVLPMVLTAVFLHHTLSKGKAVLHALPLAITGIIFAAFAADLLPVGLRSQLEGNHYGRMLLDSTDFIIGIMILLQLVSVWLFGRSAEKRSRKH